MSLPPPYGLTPSSGALRSATAAVGWVSTGVPGPRWRAYIFDVQYGNLVVRNRLLTDGDI